MKLEKSHKSCGGILSYYSHQSEQTKTEMQFTVFHPSKSEKESVPILYWLSGLTCSPENFTAKSGYQRFAEKHGICVVAPDTSPRGAGIAGEDEDWDFGTGAGFYVDATQEPWAHNYRMYSYIVEELPALIHKSFPVLANQQSISGHSMGGHGALVIGLRNPEHYRSISAFSPICAPIQSPWGEKAFSGYLGPDREAWQAYDATCLIKAASHRLPIMIDQGLGDDFLETQLKPDLFAAACEAVDYPVQIERRAGYDHSYFYISSFIDQHMEFHAESLNGVS